MTWKILTSWGIFTLGACIAHVIFDFPLSDGGFVILGVVSGMIGMVVGIIWEEKTR